ncbi:MAG: zinc-ribbon domain-containing protein, partial [Eubacterium sp.]|nr:zinc-ribbon domain-containing protein [Eubacterium sp.]
MFCRYCGNQNKDGAMFCVFCGSQIMSGATPQNQM